MIYIISYPGVTWPSCGVSGGTGEPPESSDGVFDRNKFPPNSDTNVMGELFFFVIWIFNLFLFLILYCECLCKFFYCVRVLLLYNLYLWQTKKKKGKWWCAKSNKNHHVITK